MSIVPDGARDERDAARAERDERDKEDAGLVRACLTGDKTAFDALVVRHQRTIYFLCLRFVGNHADADEAAQDAFVRAYRALSSFRQQSSFTTWLHRIAVNVCLSRVKASRPPTEPIEGSDHSSLANGEADAEARLAARQRAAALRAAISRLPDKQRATLILRAYHDLPHEEIGRILETSAGASKANFFHALRRLRQLLVNDETS